jgi:hypothetical protein
LDDRIKEQIRFNTELLKLISVLFIAVGSGFIGLLLKESRTAKDVLFIVAGMFTDLGCIISIFRMHRTTRKLINDGKSQ